MRPIDDLKNFFQATSQKADVALSPKQRPLQEALLEKRPMRIAQDEALPSSGQAAGIADTLIRYGG